MERKLDIRRCTDIASCNSCGVRNYKGLLGELDGVKSDAVLFEV